MKIDLPKEIEDGINKLSEELKLSSLTIRQASRNITEAMAWNPENIIKMVRKNNDE